MNRIKGVRYLIDNSKLFSNLLKCEKCNIKNIIENKKSILFGTSLFGVFFISYNRISENFNFKCRSALCANVLYDSPNSKEWRKKHLFQNTEESSILEKAYNKKPIDKVKESVENSAESVILETDPLPDAIPIHTTDTSSRTLTFQTETTDNTDNGLPTEVPYLIIGAGVAGMSAARAIRASDPFAKVLIINSECQNPGQHTLSYPPYKRILLSKFIWRRSEDNINVLLDTTGDSKSNSYLFLEPESFFVSPENLNRMEYGGISILNNTRVESIDVDDLSVTLDGTEHKIKFKACLIATGSYPRRLKQLEVSSNTGKNLYNEYKVSYFRSLNDFRNLYDHIRQLQTKEDGGRILIIGSGLLGTELTSSLGRLAKDQGKFEVVEVFKEKSHLYHILPEELSLYIQRNIASNHTKLISQAEVVSIDEITEGVDSGRLKINIKPLSTTDVVENVYETADHVVIAAGVKPETSLSIKARLETDQMLGGFLVNAELQAREGIFVAGDACSFYDPVLGRRRVEHWNHSEESGSIAGYNMAAYVLKIDKQYMLQRIDRSMLANDILKPKIYDFQSSFSFKLSMFKTIEALGLIDSSLETKTYIAQDFYDDTMSVDENSSVKGEQSVEREVSSVDRDRLDMPGVVFYLRNKRIVGIMLWNCDDDIVVDSELASPLRTNVARKILCERRVITSDNELRTLAADFDLSFFVNSQTKDIKEDTNENSATELQSQRH